LAISLSLVLVLGVAVWLIHKYGGMKAWQGAVCVLFGFFLATTSFAPEIRSVVTAVIRALTGHG
jgi:hypothetical protein